MFTKLIFVLLLSLLIIPVSARAEINWVEDYYNAKTLGEQHDLPIIVYFFDPGCDHCIKMEETFKDPIITEREKDFIWVRINVNDLKHHNLRDEYGLQYVPTTYFLYPNGSAITYIDVNKDPQSFLRVIDFAYSKARNIEPPVSPTPEASAAGILAVLSIILISMKIARTE